MQEKGLEASVWLVLGFIAIFILTMIGRGIAGLVVDKPYFTYSQGTMKGDSAKLSKKGFIWKTWEGYLVLGSMTNGVADKWEFSVYDDNVAKCIMNNKVVKLDYEQYLIYPIRKGSQDHVVVKCTPIK